MECSELGLVILSEVQIRETIYYDQLLEAGARGATLRHSCGLLTTRDIQGPLIYAIRTFTA